MNKIICQVPAMKKHVRAQVSAPVVSLIGAPYEVEVISQDTDSHTEVSPGTARVYGLGLRVMAEQNVSTFGFAGIYAWLYVDLRVVWVWWEMSALSSGVFLVMTVQPRC